MPELPDLEAIQDILLRELTGRIVLEASVVQAIPLRRPAPDEFVKELTGQPLTSVARRGKFLLLAFGERRVLAVNPMLTGRLQYCLPGERRRARTCFILRFDDGRELRYFDSKLMGKLYLVDEDGLAAIPGWDEMGPDALDPAVTLDIFERRLRRHPGQIKNILVNHAFLAGIGNAYADEILFAAGIYPYRRRSSLTPAETAALYEAMHRVLNEATAIVAARMGGDIHLKFRDFLQVHGKGGQPCPRCGHALSQITANERLTNYCRGCQR